MKTLVKNKSACVTHTAHVDQIRKVTDPLKWQHPVTQSTQYPVTVFSMLTT